MVKFLQSKTDLMQLYLASPQWTNSACRYSPNRKEWLSDNFFQRQNTLSVNKWSSFKIVSLTCTVYCQNDLSKQFIVQIIES